MLVEGDPGGTDAVWATTRTWYDEAGRKACTIDPMGYVTTWSYDGAGQVSEVVEWAAPVDAANLGSVAPTPTASAGDRRTQYAYDQAGNKVEESVRRSYIDDDGNAVVGDVTTTYEYDGNHRVTAVTQGDATISTSYDAMGRIASITGPSVKVLVPQWQAMLEADPSLSLDDPSLYQSDAQLIQFTYDAFGDKLTESHGGATQQIVTYYQYDLAGRMISSVTPRAVCVTRTLPLLTRGFRMLSRFFASRSRRARSRLASSARLWARMFDSGSASTSTIVFDRFDAPRPPNASPSASDSTVYLPILTTDTAYITTKNANRKVMKSA